MHDKGGVDAVHAIVFQSYSEKNKGWRLHDERMEAGWKQREAWMLNETMRSLKADPYLEMLRGEHFSPCVLFAGASPIQFASDE